MAREEKAIFKRANEKGLSGDGGYKFKYRQNVF